jgi:heme exporter protein A
LRILLENLSCRRGGRLLIADLTVALAAGEALVVTGRNGAGKSTLLATLAGRLKPAAGRILVEGDAASDGRLLPEEAILVGHRDGLKSALTARENLTFAAAIFGRPRLGPEEALAAFALAHAAEVPVGYLSAGQRRRVALARLLVSSRPVWLLDEPTTALDTASQAIFADVMRDHLAGGGLVIAATHAALGLDGLKELELDGAPVDADEDHDGEWGE